MASNIASHPSRGQPAKQENIMYTAQRIEANGQTSSVVRCASLKQLREWAPANGHEIIKGSKAQDAANSGAPVRLLASDGRVRF